MFNSTIKYGILDQNIFPLRGLISWFGDYVNSGVLRTTLSNDASINQWDNLVNTNFHLSSKIGQPTYNSTKNSIFLGAGECLYRTTTPLTGNSNSTIFTVVENSSDVRASMLFIGNANSNQYYAFGNRSAENNFQFENSGTNTTIYDGSQLEIGDVALLTVMITTNKVYNMTFRKNSIVQTISTNGSSTATINMNGGIILGGYLAPSTLTAVEFNSNKEYHIKELLIYDRILDFSEITYIENWLNKKYVVY